MRACSGLRQCQQKRGCGVSRGFGHGALEARVGAGAGVAAGAVGGAALRRRAVRGEQVFEQVRGALVRARSPPAPSPSG